MSDKLHTEDLMRSRLEGAELTPSPESWSAIQRKLRWPQFLRFNTHRFNIYYAAALLISATAVVLVLATDRDKEPVPVQNQEDTEISARANTAESPAEGSSAEAAKDTEIGEKASRSPEPTAKLTSATATKTESQTPEAENAEEKLLQSGKKEVALVLPRPGLDQQISESQAPPITYFTCSVQSGCVPLEVHFTDKSVHATSYKWDFGTGDVSTEVNPEYLFKEAGSYLVTLTTTNHGSPETVSRMRIEVENPPVADFQIEEGLSGVDSHVVLNLVNYSSDATLYEWCLVDEGKENCSAWTSVDQQPNLELKTITSDSRAVRLRVISEHGCVDTTVMPLPIVVESSETRIKFANAFSPNPSGPGDGSFTPGAKRIDVFHPIYMEVPVEFHMRVFTRRGELIFETREIFEGWCGYMNQEAAPGDVYVWMAEGKWADGEGFNLRGDVTLVWNKYW